LALAVTGAHAGPQVVRNLFVLDRAVGYLALAVLCGGGLFLVLVWPEGADVRRTRQLLAAAWGAGAVSAAAGLGLQAATVRRGDLGTVVDVSAVGDVLDTTAGRAWAARSLLFLLALPLLGALGRDGAHTPRATWWRTAALAVALGLLRTFGLAGHSTEGSRSVVGAVADLLHVAAVATWIGGLVMLAAVVLPRRRVDELAAVVPRFSSVAKVAVGTAVAAGAVLTWAITGGLDGLLHTHYGRVLLLKATLLGAALVAAHFSKRWVDDRLRLAVVLRGDPVTVRPFVVSVAAEVVFAVAVLGVASVLVTTSPGT
jgi:putative copper export protein